MPDQASSREPSSAAVPTVSVIVPLYNVERFVEKAIRSVLEQTFADFELLIVDDGSTDNSVQICRGVEDPRIRILSQENRGVAEARNHGIRAARGEFVALLDADDMWVPEKLQQHVEQLRAHSNVGISFSRCMFIDEHDSPAGLYQMSKIRDVEAEDFLYRSPVGNGSTAVMRRQVFLDAAIEDAELGECYFDPDRALHPSEDVECWFRIATTTDWLFLGIAAPLTHYRLNAAGHSADVEKKSRSWERLLEKAAVYAPKIIAERAASTRAYHWRYLARRAVSLHDGRDAVRLCHQAIREHPRILLEEPARTLTTLLASYSLRVLPLGLFTRLQRLGMRVARARQERRIGQG
ncbi:MAG: glycosyltransferase [Planctomycetota bacterium]